MNTRKDQRGFHVIGTMMIVVVLGAIGYSGWYVWKSNQKFHNPVAADNAATSSSNASGSADDKTPGSTSAAQKVETETYSNDQYGFSFSYPKTWKLEKALSNFDGGKQQGDVAVTSPNQTVVKFNLNQGGKGGDCIDTETDTRTSRTCSTVSILNVRQLTHRDGYKDLYYFQAKEKTADRFGGKLHYAVGLATDDNGAPKVGSSLTPFLAVILHNPRGYVNIDVTGSDDDQVGSESFLASTEAKEAASILNTVSLTAN